VAVAAALRPEGRIAMPRLLTALLLTGLAMAPAPAMAQATSSAEPFAVGTFGFDGREGLGLVLRQSLVVELDAANNNLQMEPGVARMAMPEDMLQLIGLYEYGLKHRLYEIVNHLVGSKQLEARRPGFVHDVKSVQILAPIRYPKKILNAAGNFYTHTCEGCTPEQQAENDKKIRANRGVPYLFLKPGEGAVIGSGQAVVIPPGRDRIDWEIEFGTVIGRPARYVSATRAQDYVFGYTVTIDMSDRGGRPGTRSSDWFVGKGHETFAPMGPWIVPKEFYGDPMKRLHQQLSIDGVKVQEAKAGDMIHNIWELIEYGSSIITLFPGDVINSGTTGGTSSGAFKRGTRAGYLKPGETIEATIEGIGTLRHPVVAGKPLPTDLTGSQLPAVGTYRPAGSPPPPPQR
jgi:2-keto-4-pentenoate hydratase/2-oxohepta-3-ene-1,7-dioic acid hydratase in catechol pathway